MDMNLDDFIKKYDGKGVDYDGNGKYWCVDLYRQYCNEVLGLSQSPLVVGAADIWDTYLKDYFDQIANTPMGIPEKGSIMLWNKNAGGGYGHVAIFIEGDVNSFKSFDQNWPTGSLCHIQGHYYKNILGWLKPKGEPKEEQNVEDKISDLQTELKSANEALAEKSLEVNNLRTSLETQERDNKDLAEQLLEARTQRNQAVGEKKDLERKVADLEKQIVSLKSDITSLQESETRLREALTAQASLQKTDFEVLKESVSNILRVILRRR